MAWGTSVLSARSARSSLAPGEAVRNPLFLSRDRYAQPDSILQIRRFDRHRAVAELLGQAVLLQESHSAVDSPAPEIEIHTRARGPAERGFRLAAEVLVHRVLAVRVAGHNDAGLDAVDD